MDSESQKTEQDIDSGLEETEQGFQFRKLGALCSALNILIPFLIFGYEIRYTENQQLKTSLLSLIPNQAIRLSGSILILVLCYVFESKIIKETSSDTVSTLGVYFLQLSSFIFHYKSELSELIGLNLPEFDGLSMLIEPDKVPLVSYLFCSAIILVLLYSGPMFILIFKTLVVGAKLGLFVSDTLNLTNTELSKIQIFDQNSENINYLFFNQNLAMNLKNQLTELNANLNCIFLVNNENKDVYVSLDEVFIPIEAIKNLSPESLSVSIILKTIESMKWDSFLITSFSIVMYLMISFYELCQILNILIILNKALTKHGDILDQEINPRNLGFIFKVHTKAVYSLVSLQNITRFLIFLARLLINYLIKIMEIRRDKIFLQKFGRESLIHFLEEKIHKSKLGDFSKIFGILRSEISFHERLEHADTFLQ